MNKNYQEIIFAFRFIRFTSQFLIVALVVLIISCGSHLDEQEVTRLTSPEKVVDAVVIRKNGGATTSLFYEVYIVPDNENVSGYNPVLKADKVTTNNGNYGFTIEWESSKVLKIEFHKARIFHFSNFWHSKKIHNFDYIIEIRLVQTSNEHNMSEK